MTLGVLCFWGGGEGLRLFLLESKQPRFCFFPFVYGVCVGCLVLRHIQVLCIFFLRFFVWGTIKQKQNRIPSAWSVVLWFCSYDCFVAG